MAYVPDRSYRPPVIGPRATRLVVSQIGFGDQGSADTLTKMRQAALGALRDPRVLEAGAQIVRAAPPRDRDRQVALLRDWIQRHTLFLNDPPAMELVRTPGYLLDRIGRDGKAQGDCDDMAVLAAALGMAAGLKARFIAVGFQGPKGPLSHVFTELLTDRGWQEMDVTRPLGRAVPTVTRRVIREI
jgi:transglutaminase-like putative cysteine protease